MPELLPEWAFYYPNPVWSQSDWLKNLILFFDGIALLAPEYARDQPDADPSVAELERHGLLRMIEPRTFMDRRGAEVLGTAMADFLTSGSLDELIKRPTEFQALSYSHLGYLSDGGLAERIYEALHTRGLAAAGAGGQLHATVRSLVLVLFAQVLRPTGLKHGMYLCPVTDRPELHRALAELVGLPSLASAAHVVSLDLQVVGVDLSDVPIDEVVAYRREHRERYRQFTRNLRNFVHRTVDAPADGQYSELLELQATVVEAAAHLAETARRAWNQPASFAIGFAGGAWHLKPNDLMGGLLALGAEAGEPDRRVPTRAGAFSYLFSDHSPLS